LEEIQNFAIAQEHHLDKIRMTHRLMDGNNINKSIKDDKIDYVVMGLKVPLMVRVFSGTHTGNVLTDVTFRYSVFNRCKIQENGLHTFRPKIKKRLKSSEIGKNGRCKVKCLYVKTSKSDVDKRNN
jgi:hypothetical protein